jgi:hypothetical protein
VVSLTLFRNHSVTRNTSLVEGARGFGGVCRQHREDPLRVDLHGLKRPGLRAHYQTGCRHAHFDPGCGMNNQAYKIAGTVSAVSGLNGNVQWPSCRRHPDG